MTDAERLEKLRTFTAHGTWPTPMELAEHLGHLATECDSALTEVTALVLRRTAMENEQLRQTLAYIAREASNVRPAISSPLGRHVGG